jgi:PTS system N-acetylgalactosamine-specific IIA component
MSGNISRKIMSDSVPAENPRAILIGHGDFAAGLISAVNQICGAQATLLTGLSMVGMTPADLESTLRSKLESTGASVIFTDLPAGSATIAARRIVKQSPNVVLVSGVNLATLLDFVFNSAMSPADAARAAAERGKASLIVVTHA